MNIAAAFAEQKLPGISPSVYGPADFAAIAEIVQGEAGIVLPTGKAMLVYSRIAPLVRASGAGSFSEYIPRLTQDPYERKKAIDALTTNHTFFYREAHHFEHFAERVRPMLVGRLDRGGPVRMWSAGCSSGEETWSLVSTLLGEDRIGGRRLAQKDVVLLASDLSEQILKKAKAATYPAESLGEIPEKLRANWFKLQGEEAEVVPEARSIVRFRELNLLGPWPMQRRFDVIFCRNVMIYFDLPTKERLVARFAEALEPGGHLYIGHSERVTGSATTLLEPVGPTIYRRI